MSVKFARLASGLWSGTMNLLGQSPGKARVVKTIRVVNKGTTNATLNVNIWRATNPQGTTGDERAILPKDTPLPPGYLLIEEQDLTLEQYDKITGTVAGGNMEYVISGIERTP